MMSERSLVRLIIHYQEVPGKDAREIKITWRGWRLPLGMSPAPKTYRNLFRVKPAIISFYAVVIY